MSHEKSLKWTVGETSPDLNIPLTTCHYLQYDTVCGFILVILLFFTHLYKNDQVATKLLRVRIEHIQFVQDFKLSKAVLTLTDIF